VCVCVEMILAGAIIASSEACLLTELSLIVYTAVVRGCATDTAHAVLSLQWPLFEILREKKNTNILMHSVFGLNVVTIALRGV